MPRSGDVLYVGSDASVQFNPPCDFLFRVIRVHGWDTYVGWIWLDGYQLLPDGDAVERRTIWVQIAGLHQVGKVPDPRTRNTRPRHTRPIPRPRPPADTTTTSGRTR